MRRIILGLAALLVLVLVIMQLVLPGIATDRLRDRLSKSGQVLQVQISAFPAVELLWDQADKVVVRMNTYTSNPGHFGSLLNDAAGVGTLDASANRLQAGPLVLHDASLHKRGNQVTATATIQYSDVQAALPILTAVGPVSSAGGQVILQATASAFGLGVTAQVVVSAQDGKIVVAPNIPLGGLATITLFNNPALAVDSISAQPVPGGFRATATAHLR